jgi:hypothetical protein
MDSAGGGHGDRGGAPAGGDGDRVYGMFTPESFGQLNARLRRPI